MEEPNTVTFSRNDLPQPLYAILTIIALWLPMPIGFDRAWGFSLTAGYVPLGWIMVAVAYFV